MEAKSTGRAYNLPTDDARALADYVSQVRATLTTVPPLRFVMVLGPSAAKPLTNRLQHLEQQLGLPVRFASASSLGRLRESIPGPVPMAAFLECVLAGPEVLSEDFWVDAASRFRGMQEAHESFVRTLLGTRP
jgi:hypothetical protein